MKFPRRFLPLLTTGAALLLVAGCGDSDSSSSGSSGSAKSANGVDRAFVAGMVPHHESAVEMATIAQRRGSSTFVKQLADDIVRTQNEEIATMRSADKRLKSAGIATGSLGVPDHMMGIDGDVATLKTATPFDRAFMQLMLPHHEAAIPMAKAEIAKGGDGELKQLAEGIITAQEREIAGMRKQLGTSGSTTPHGSGGAHDDATHGSG